MTLDEVSLVQNSWQLVVPISDQAAKIFYERLFLVDPALKPLFKGDLREQEKKLMTMIGAAVNSLNNLDLVVPAVQRLGERHAKYGVKDADYATVGGALLWTLEQGLGKAFTPEVKQAWTTVYGVLATTMKDAARKVDA